MSTLWQLTFVASGGALGAIARFAIAEGFTRLRLGGGQVESGLPIATLAANLVGCFLIGFLLGSGLGEKFPAAKYGLGIGFLGALTTFSTFSAESVQQIQTGQSLSAVAYIIISVMAGMLLVFAGMALGKRWI